MPDFSHIPHAKVRRISQDPGDPWHHEAKAHLEQFQAHLEQFYTAAVGGLLRGERPRRARLAPLAPRRTQGHGQRERRPRRRSGASSRTASADPGEPEPAGDHPALAAGWRNGRVVAELHAHSPNGEWPANEAQTTAERAA